MFPHVLCSLLGTDRPHPTPANVHADKPNVRIASPSAVSFLPTIKLPHYARAESQAAPADGGLDSPAISFSAAGGEG